MGDRTSRASASSFERVVNTCPAGRDHRFVHPLALDKCSNDGGRATGPGEVPMATVVLSRCMPGRCEVTNADWRRSRWLGRAVRRACAYRSGRASLLLSALRPRYGVPVPTVSVYDVAAEMRSRLPGIGTKKLHKLLYYCQGHHLATFGQPLFTETISAWDMGPVVGSLWFQEKQDGIKEASSELAEAALNTLGYVVSRYGALTARDLEHLTHSEAPWQEANSRRSPGTSAKIDLRTIASYFRDAEMGEEDSDTVLLDADDVAAWLTGAVERRGEQRRLDSVESIRARLRVSAS